MNPPNCFPHWNFDSDLPFTNQRKPNQDLMELLYRNGQVVAQSQTHRRPNHEPTQQIAESFGGSDVLGPPDTVTASWIEYPVEELSSHFLIDPMETDNPTKQFEGGGRRDVVKECSGMTVGSSHCGSNHCGSHLFGARDLPKNMGPRVEARKVETEPTNVTSSSDGSGGSSFGGGTNKNSAATNGLKRKKGGDVEDSECQSEAAEQESGGGKKSGQLSGSTRRSRAAEVHNLSERKRRDRINKKMRALQELIPHCNKMDKASMLDEAIEYLKSLQIQLQMMWMGGAMAAPMMFPGMQPYMVPMAMGMTGMGVHNNMSMPKVPVADQSMPMATTPNQNAMSQTPILNPVNFQNQMQNQSSFPDQFARYMTMHQMQAATNSQPMNMFRFGPQSIQPPHVNAVPVTSMGHHGVGASTNDALMRSEMGQ